MVGKKAIRMRGAYFLALLLSIALFAILLFLVYVLDSERVSKLDRQIMELSWETEDSRLFMLYNDFLKENDRSTKCALWKTRLEQQSEKRVAFAEELQKYEEANAFSNDYYRVKRTFLLKNVEFLFYYMNYEKECDPNATWVLYFYPDRKQCIDCEVQAAVLDKLRNKCKNVINFAFPINFDVDIVNILKVRYNVTGVPTTILDGNSLGNGKVIDYESLLNGIYCEDR